MKQFLFVVALALSVAACGSDAPTAPTPPPPAQISGLWSGTLTSSQFAPQAISVGLNQTGSTIAGTWVNVALGWNGNVTGTVDATTFTGTFTLNRGTTCTGASGSFNGPSNPTSLHWSSAGFTGGTCSGPPTGVALTLTK